MHFSEISIDHFGPIKHLHIPLQPQGINMIIGDNAVGKTQLLAAIYTVFFDNSLLQYHKDSAETGRVSLRVSSLHGELDLTKEFTSHSVKLCVNDFNSLVKASKINQNELYFFSPENYANTNHAYPKEMIRNSYKFLCDLGLQSHHILGTCLAKKEVNILMSTAEQRYIEIIHFLSQLPENSILLGDSVFSGFDALMKNMVLAVFKKMNKRQFILAESTHTISDLSTYDVAKANLNREYGSISPVSYNYTRIQQKISEAKFEDTDLVVPINYFINQKVSFEECKEIELKEIKGGNPCDTIIATAEIYINAFLNCLPQNTGRIFWGVDDNKTVKGVNLSYKDKDTIQKRIAETLAQAQPYISPDLYYIKFNRVFDEVEKIIPDYYVVEVGVFPYRSDRLFATSKGEVYIKTTGGKKKLSALQIQEQVLIRTGRYLKK